MSRKGIDKPEAINDVTNELMSGNALARVEERVVLLDHSIGSISQLEISLRT